MYSMSKPIGILIPFGIFFVIVYFLTIFLGPTIWIRFTLYFSAVMLFIFTSIYLSIRGPPKYKYNDEDWDDENLYYKPAYDNGKWNVVLDTHCHTTVCEGKLSLEQAIKWHKSLGFNATVITEHNSMKNMDEVLEIKEKYKEDFIIIPGIEYTTYRIHMCFMGITEWDTKSIPTYPTDNQIKEAINKVHEMGGVVSACHFPWSTWGQNPRMPDHPTREQVYEWGVDFIEVANWDEFAPLVDYISYDFVQSLPNIAPCTGTDMHEPLNCNPCGWTLVSAKEFTQEAILEELRNHRTEVILDPESVKYTIPHAENISYKVLRPFIMFGEKFQEVRLGGKPSNLDVAAINMWLIYFFIVFLILELLRYVGI